MRPRRTTEVWSTQTFRRALIVALFITGFALGARSARAAEPRYPAFTGRVVDEAGILTDSTRAALTDMLAQHERATGNQVVVVTLKDLQGYTIDDFGYQLGRKWGIGQKERNNGVLLIVAPKEHKLRIEVGYGLEGTLTDAMSRDIIEREILPAFRRGDFNAGLLAGVGSILTRLSGNAVVGTPSGTGPVSGSSYDNVGQTWLLALFLIALCFVWQRLALRYGGFEGGRGFFGGGGFSSGGGFSGGGGSFGGGGASGGW